LRPNTATSNHNRTKKQDQIARADADAEEAKQTHIDTSHTMAATMASALLTTMTSRFTAAAATDEHLQAMSIAQLRSLIIAAGLSHADCLEKHELVARAREAEAHTAQAQGEARRRSAARRAEVPGSDWQDAARAGFVRKVYGIIAVQIAVNVAMVAIACWSPLFLYACLWAQEYAWYCAMAVLIGLTRAKHRYPLNYGLLMGFTLIEGTTIASVCALYFYNGHGDVVASAGVLTAVAFGTLSLYAHRTGADFSYLRGALYCGLATLCAVFLCQWMWPPNDLSGPGIWTAYAAVLLFAGFILYDTDRISKRHGMPLDDYIVGAVELYLDIVNLFLSLLRILSPPSKEEVKREASKGFRSTTV
jgi:FtsH-binding integral membrane protein